MEDETIIISAMLVTQIALMTINLVNLSKKTKTRYLNKIWWLIIILLGSMTGNIIYVALECSENNSNKKKSKKK